MSILEEVEAELRAENEELQVAIDAVRALLVVLPSGRRVRVIQVMAAQFGVWPRSER